ncbi:MAG: hypothetical protein FWG31_06085 [Oscillospiraceae bacterium]|nr:hypothetical protein [Oscillospiraceae bacterium]
MPIHNMELRTVRVADIAEFPTELGSRCLLLHEIGLDAYWNTDEELMDALTESAKDPDMLNICIKNSRCKAFLDKFRQGVTPYIERDPIRLMEYGGRYWVSEGKHRVCMAKRGGVEKIDAYVWPLEEDDYSILSAEGSPGRFSFQCVYTQRGYRQVKGNTAVLWVQSPRGNQPSRFDFGSAVLDWRLDTRGEPRTVFPGLSYSVKVSESSVLGFCKKYTVQAEIVIEEDHAKTRVWLLSRTGGSFMTRHPYEAPRLNTLYRFGCWRNHHMRRIQADPLRC